MSHVTIITWMPNPENFVTQLMPYMVLYILNNISLLATIFDLEKKTFVQ